MDTFFVKNFKILTLLVLADKFPGIQEPKREPEPSEACFRNQNQNRPFPAKAVEEPHFRRGTVGTENRNRSNRSMLKQTIIKLWGTKKAHKLLTHKLCLPPFVPGMSQGQTGFVPGTNWASAV